MPRPNILILGIIAFAVLLITVSLTPVSPVRPKDYLCANHDSSNTFPTDGVVPANNIVAEEGMIHQSLPVHKNVVLYMLVPPSRLHQATLAIKSTENSFNRRLKYPYVIFMSESELGEVSEEMKGKINWLTEGRASFAALREEDWSVPAGLDPHRMEESLQKIGFSTNYRKMCRFNSGLFWRHPALAKYDWLWRLDTDIIFHCDVPYDPIQRLVDANALYGMKFFDRPAKLMAPNAHFPGFVQISGDADSVQPSLASNVSEFLATHPHLIPPDANHGFVWHNEESIEKALSGHAVTDDWTRQCMYAPDQK
ncbi:hypothetical protein V5O48_001565 [Marasmius crinis-equi]|uniref:Uncharacterized protein n=1 Tax=Marasmius crinis-equi TaxID=585013 RepID=A0ABR3FY66_9AGAR